MLDVIVSRGLPLDRITTSDVWATDTISACLQKMDKEAVKGLALNVAKAENERDEALRTLAKVDEHINILNRLLSDYRNNLKRS